VETDFQLVILNIFKTSLPYLLIEVVPDQLKHLNAVLRN